MVFRSSTPFYWLIEKWALILKTFSEIRELIFGGNWAGLFDKLDENGDGTLSLGEFMAQDEVRNSGGLMAALTAFEVSKNGRPFESGRSFIKLNFRSRKSIQTRVAKFQEKNSSPIWPSKKRNNLFHLFLVFQINLSIYKKKY